MKTNVDIPCPHCNRKLLIVDNNNPTKIEKTQILRYYVCRLCDTQVRIITKR